MPDFKYIVVGAGMMGAAAARHLSAQTDGVALIGPAEPANRRTHTGVFSSHYDEARITRGFDGDPVWAALAQRSIRRYAEIEAKAASVSSPKRAVCLPETARGLPETMCRARFPQRAVSISVWKR